MYFTWIKSLCLDIYFSGAILLLIQQSQTQIHEKAFTFVNPNSEHDDHKLEQLCYECRLTSQSIDELVRGPRQMDAYGQMSRKIDLDKIKKAVCKELSSDSERESCRNFYFKNQPSISKWQQANTRASFLDFVCIKELKYCCPSNSFGSKCKKCTQCNQNQQCHGDGTRAGNGTCICKPGHAGQRCASCLPGYYNDKQANLKLKTNSQTESITLCKPCHRSCHYCRQGGSQGCEVCRNGFVWVPGLGCSDIDECVQSNNKICGDNTFCVNTEGSYFCYECDRACDGCYGDGPDMCLKCGPNYKMDKGNCVAQKKSILPPEANYYRYAIYAGLCVSTCIILHNNVYIASSIGLIVALYIGASEYVMSGQPQEYSGANSFAAGNLLNKVM